MNWKPYTGTLNTRSDKMTKVVRRAQGVFNGQRQRCINKNVKHYKNYGARGIRVQYTARDFIGWYLSEIEKRKFKMPSVGRIDHDKDYSFDNIQMVEQAENAREMYHRTGGNKEVQKRAVVLVHGDECYKFSSVKEAAEFAGVTQVRISQAARSEQKKKIKLAWDVYYFDDFVGGA